MAINPIFLREVYKYTIASYLTALSLYFLSLQKNISMNLPQVETEEASIV